MLTIALAERYRSTLAELQMLNRYTVTYEQWEEIMSWLPTAYERGTKITFIPMEVLNRVQKVLSLGRYYTIWFMQSACFFTNLECFVRRSVYTNAATALDQGDRIVPNKKQQRKTAEEVHVILKSNEKYKPRVWTFSENEQRLFALFALQQHKAGICHDEAEMVETNEDVHAETRSLRIEPELIGDTASTGIAKQQPKNKNSTQPVIAMPGTRTKIYLEGKFDQIIAMMLDSVSEGFTDLITLPASPGADQNLAAVRFWEHVKDATTMLEFDEVQKDTTVTYFTQWLLCCLVKDFYAMLVEEAFEALGEDHDIPSKVSVMNAGMQLIQNHFMRSGVPNTLRYNTVSTAVNVIALLTTLIVAIDPITKQMLTSKKVRSGASVEWRVSRRDKCEIEHMLVTGDDCSAAVTFDLDPRDEIEGFPEWIGMLWYNLLRMRWKTTIRVASLKATMHCHHVHTPVGAWYNVIRLSERIHNKTFILREIRSKLELDPKDVKEFLESVMQRVGTTYTPPQVYEVLHTDFGLDPIIQDLLYINTRAVAGMGVADLTKELWDNGVREISRNTLETMAAFADINLTRREWQTITP